MKVVGAPGYENFEADLIMEIPAVTGELMSVVRGFETKEIFVIPSRYVEESE